MNMNQSRWFEGWRFALILLAAAFIARLPTIFCGFYNPDETCYATIANQILNGKHLYIDIVDHKPPLIYYLYAIFSLIGGSGAIKVAHIAIIIIIAGTAAILAKCARALDVPPWAALATALLYIIGASCGKPSDAAAANAELIFNLPLTLMIFCILRSANESFKKHSLAWIVGAGFLGGVAVLIKIHAIMALAPIFLFFMVQTSWNLRTRFWACMIMLISFALPIIVTALFLHLQGNLDEAVYWSFTANFRYVKGHEQGLALFGRIVRQLLYMFAEYFFLWLPLIAWPFVKRQGQKLGNDKINLLWLWLLFSILAVIPGLRFFGHYFMQMLPPLAILCGLALSGIVSAIRIPRIVIAAWLATILAAFLHSWIWAFPSFWLDKKSEPVENQNLIKFLKTNVGQDERIEVWGRFNGIPFMVDRENGTRFLNKNLLAGSFRGDDLVQMPEKHWDMFFEDMNSNRPEWFVDHSAVDMRLAPVVLFPRLKKYLARYYIPVTAIDGSAIYRLKNPAHK